MYVYVYLCVCVCVCVCVCIRKEDNVYYRITVLVFILLFFIFSFIIHPLLVYSIIALFFTLTPSPPSLTPTGP